MTEQPETIAFCHACGAPMDVSAVAPFTNVECPQCGKHTRVKREFGPYTLVRRHAIGGMSMVFTAHDNTLDREVALKILSEGFSKDERRIAAFEEEARITASFSHPNVVRVLRTGRAFDRFYIAMEFVPGGHFEHHIRERGKIPEVELLPLAIEVAQGLKAAHAAGLIHRDVKPGNILLDAEGHAKLVDFGLALVTQGGTAKATEFWATPYYVPPETVEGYEEDFRSDIYALGATLYHALSGKPSCGEESMSTDVLREAKKKIVPLSVAEPNISAETSRVVERAMAYLPDDRYASYDELIADLAVALSHLKSGHAEAPESPAKRRAGKKRKERIVVASGGMVLLAAIGGAIWWLNRPEPEPVVDTPPPVAMEPPPPVVADTSGEIARSYRDARASVESRDFASAAARFQELFKNPLVQEPTRTWAGLEAVMAHFLDGRPADARLQAGEVLGHMGSLPEVAPQVGGVTGILDGLDEMPAISAPDDSDGGASQVIAAMLAGLKNWEQGMIDPAADCFRSATAVILQPEDSWATVYQELAADYLADYEVLSGPLFHELPPDKAGCAAAMDALDEALATMKTRGRARFNVRAWQLDLARRGKLLEAAESAPPPQTEPQPPKLSEMLTALAEYSAECRFQDAVSYLKSLPLDPPGAKLSSLISVAELSAVFLTDIERDLLKQPVAADLQLKSGETVTKVSIDSQGLIIATFADGRSRSCGWGDFQPDALIALHRVLVRNPTNEAERLRRHECAIAFDWLAGNRERALAAAAVLSQSSAEFKKRWDEISDGLPK